MWILPAALSMVMCPEIWRSASGTTFSSPVVFEKLDSVKPVRTASIELHFESVSYHC